MIVVDASAAISALLDSGVARQRLSTDALHAPHLIDSWSDDGRDRAALTSRRRHVRSPHGICAVDDRGRFDVDRVGETTISALGRGVRGPDG